MKHWLLDRSAVKFVDNRNRIHYCGMGIVSLHAGQCDNQCVPVVPKISLVVSSSTREFFRKYLLEIISKASNSIFSEKINLFAKMS